MRRAAETAKPLGATANLPIIELAGLQEVEAGDFEGATKPSDLDRYRAVIASWARGAFDVPVPGAEDGNQFLSRFDAAMRTVRAGSDPERTTVVVSHSVAIRVWVASRCDNTDASFTATAPLGNTDLVDVEAADDGSLTLVQWGLVAQEPPHPAQ